MAAEKVRQPSAIFPMPAKWGIPHIFLAIPCILSLPLTASSVHVKITKATGLQVKPKNSEL
jgi:hypothetical protein